MSVASSYGTNIAFIEELFEKYRHDPSSVSASWREFFQDYEGSPEHDGDGDGPEAVATPPVAVAAIPAAAAGAVFPIAPAPAKAVASDTVDLIPLRGAASKIVQNMEASLTLPTATSVRNIPVKALEENRRVINHHLSIVGQSKASFTHVIAWAIVKALKNFPRLNSAYTMNDGTPTRVDHQDINLGVAVDVEKKDGSRSLLVPNIKRAQSLDFAQFLKAYNDLVKKARTNSLQVSDFEGTTISLTNPGTIGTISSIPRLMQTQGAIIATGQIDYPAEYSAADHEVLAELGVSKVMTITSTYDHRIIQGAESGAFLAKIHELLLGEGEFYDAIFRDLRIPYEPVRWGRDRKRSLFGAGQQEDLSGREAGVLQMLNAYRVRGHLIADLDPLEYKVGYHAELNPAYYGLTIWDLDREFICGGLCGKPTARLRDILETLRETYCGKLGPEFMHIQEPLRKKWLQDRMEPTRNSFPLDGALKRRILMKLNDAEAFEKFLHTKFVGHKRFSLEGAETLIPMLDHLLNLAVGDNVVEAVVGMAHRGRLTVLATTIGKSYEKIFSEFEGDIDPNTTQGSGDVKYHLGAEGTHVGPDGRKLKLTLASNPSHLEAVDPVVEGIARARQKLLADSSRKWIIPILIHGDAAFAGQGVVAETLNLSQLNGYKTGGTVHIVINNQIGFTTGPESARSSVYSTDVAKMVQAPIFHVNGDDPEACIRAIQLAFEFRQEFSRDVVIDMFCYRRHGHNEADDPSLTQPKMYKLIKDHRSVRKLYTEALLRKGDLGPEEAEQWLDSFRNKLQEAFDRTHEQTTPPSPSRPLWTDEEVTGIQDAPSPDTAITTEALTTVGKAVVSLPDGFGLHPKLKPIIERRRAMAEGRENIDWAFGEMMAFGSLLLDGYRVRLSGQDSGRGTFSHRHAILFDFNTGQGWVSLNVLAQNHKPSLDLSRPQHAQVHNALMISTEEKSAVPVNFSVYDSLLSEYGVLGFEYGYSVADPGALVLWEAQFGDFMNGAQIVIDQFISSAEEKWSQHSGLVLLLPHGYEGQGPEHSSARLERFLTLCAEGNMQVVNVTTPAQYFHLLRRQMKNNPRKPLVVMTPKSLLRHPAATSTLDQLVSGRFEPVLDDPAFAAEGSARDAVKRVVFVSGKLFYDLKAARDAAGNKQVALLRLEQFYPWPKMAIANVLSGYLNAKEFVWTQEEPRNMGGWHFVHDRMTSISGLRELAYIGRPISASPATGSHTRHEEQQKAIMDAVVGM
ncbi:MAG TPA: multifunctional oxoglutarate decarboxylase/oxoglutarate dehydrogenase thiamine pyrophosphate-binding subunit/dihydrolipoyllysine-residue succinyltransferase subunit [Thermoanaerobaculia bacterium]|nr:multifunctional oxoglutarate decarboxylase/oxoglutarate dehydrogenase thiamine pyrophosphate-binding subunit/dihydrolipoyllysine-residue succinyltransferase subunit [Thermoanaerobaculia bacterium]